MAEVSGSNGIHGVVLNVNDEANHPPPPSACKSKDSDIGFYVPFMQKVNSIFFFLVL